MDNEKQIYQKGKGPYLYPVEHQKRFDLRFNANIIGYSFPRLTHKIKNHLSNCWNICGVKTIYHKRWLNLIGRQLFPGYELRAVFSHQEFYLRLLQYAVGQGMTINYVGKRFNLWAQARSLVDDRLSHKINAYDMAEIYLDAGPDQALSHCIQKLNVKKLAVFDYYWFPELKIPLFQKPGLVVLPSLYSGHFQYLNLLIARDHNELIDQFEPIDQIPALYIASSITLYHLLARNKNPLPLLNWQDFKIKGRLFSYQDINQEKIAKIYQNYQKKMILLSNQPPYYQYLPIILKEYQLNYLNKVKP